MKHLTLADKSVLTGDTTADLIAEYAAALGRSGRSSTVEFRAIDDRGEQTVVTLLVNHGLSLVLETTKSVLPEPDNAHLDAYLRTQIEGLHEERSASPRDVSGERFFNEAPPE